MKRYYISPMVLGPVIAGAQSWVPKVTLLLGNVSYTAELPEPPDQGWAFVVVESPSHTLAIADLESDALPDLTLDITLAVLTSQQRNGLLNRMQARGLDTTGLGVNSAFREVIQRIGRSRRANFDENAFDAAVS